MLPVIAITNASTVLTDGQVCTAIPALQEQVSRDFKGYWDRDCSLKFLSKTDVLPKGWWQIVALDDPDQAGALGYHELSEQGTPLAKVFAGLDLKLGSSWTVTMSHELLEMLIDPDINLVSEMASGQLYAYEVCDAVEADDLAYRINGVLVSDFVTRRWFSPSVGCDRLSYRKNVNEPGELARGGYISVLNSNGTWVQKNADKTFRSLVAASPMGSRRWRRSMPRSLWRNSRSQSPANSNSPKKENQ